MDNFFKNDAKNKLVKIAIIVLSVVVLLITVFLVLNKNEYKKIEEQMLVNAKEYISKNNIEVTNQEYIFIENLNINNGAELCSRASGVVVTKDGNSIKYYPYLKCLDYESKILNNSKDYIELNGPDVVLVNLGTLYSDKGYTAKKEVDVETIGIVPNEVGAYTINYVVSKDGNQKTVVKRIVIVSNYDTKIVLSDLNDKEKPNILLKGEKEVLLKLNQKYVEPGYVAYDYKDGNLTKKVKIANKEIDTKKVGDYNISYSVKNSRGKETTVIRKIKVVKNLSNLDIQVTTAENGSSINESIIKILVAGNGFKSITLPDGKTLEDNQVDYNVSKNGTYLFKVEDEFGNTINKSVAVNNIDSSNPTGTCSAETKKGETVINVIAEDDRGVASVAYILDGNESGYLASTVYRTKENITLAEAMIKDVSGNITRVPCTFKNKGNNNEEYYSFKKDNSRPIIKCDSYTEAQKKDLELKLASAINDAGYGTRAGVVEAARFLVGGLDYRIPYLSPKSKEIDPDGILGHYDQKGFNIANSNGWGCNVKGLIQGIDSIDFVKWALINAGVSLEDLSSDNNIYKTSEVINKINVGDMLITPCNNNCNNGNKFSNIGIIIGLDNSKIYVAEVSSLNDNSTVITELIKNKIPKTGNFSNIKLYNYSSNGNITKMWK